jgi:hypothetical protein
VILAGSFPGGRPATRSPRSRFAPDSPLEGDGFEPSVPHKKRPFLAAPVRSRNSPSATKTGSFVPGPMVRIRFPPALSQLRTGPSRFPGGSERGLRSSLPRLAAVRTPRSPARGVRGRAQVLIAPSSLRSFGVRTYVVGCSGPLATGRGQPRRIAMNRSPKQTTAPVIVVAVDGSCNAAPITTKLRRWSTSRTRWERCSAPRSPCFDQPRSGARHARGVEGLCPILGGQARAVELLDRPSRGGP